MGVKKRILLATSFLLFLSCNFIIAQQRPHLKPAIHQYQKTTKEPDKILESFYIGFGIGLDNGGLGLKLQCVSNEKVGVFFGGGVVYSKFGYNAGIKYLLLQNTKLALYFL